VPFLVNVYDNQQRLSEQKFGQVLLVFGWAVEGKNRAWSEKKLK
jgi:hypothetical protein